MEIDLFQVDAFTDEVFKGNPSAVCIMDEYPGEELMGLIAMENNLSETAFVKPLPKGKYFIRWFTPKAEVDLCGHATLASAFILFEHLGDKKKSVVFETLHSGRLEVRKKGDWLYMNFPGDKLKAVRSKKELAKAMGCKPIKVLKGKSDYLLVYESEDQIVDLQPDMRLLSKIEARGVIATALGKETDFVSRFFAPAVGIDEDPVTGSAHTTLSQYWAKELGRSSLTAMQLSGRRGFIHCEVKGDRVQIGGQARLYMRATVFIDG